MHMCIYIYIYKKYIYLYINIYIYIYIYISHHKIWAKNRGCVATLTFSNTKAFNSSPLPRLTGDLLRMAPQASQGASGPKVVSGEAPLAWQQHIVRFPSKLEGEGKSLLHNLPFC